LGNSQNKYFENVGIWEFGNYGNLGISQFWEFGNYGNLGISQIPTFPNSQILKFGKFPI